MAKSFKYYCSAKIFRKIYISRSNSFEVFDNESLNVNSCVSGVAGKKHQNHIDALKPLGVNYKIWEG